MPKPPLIKGTPKREVIEPKVWTPPVTTDPADWPAFLEYIQTVYNDPVKLRTRGDSISARVYILLQERNHFKGRLDEAINLLMCWLVFSEEPDPSVRARLLEDTKALLKSLRPQS